MSVISIRIFTNGSYYDMFPRNQEINEPNELIIYMENYSTKNILSSDTHLSRFLNCTARRVKHMVKIYL